MQAADSRKLYTVASASSLSVLCVVDAVLLAPSFDFFLWAGLILIALSVGTLHGLAWFAMLELSERLPRRVRNVVWAVVAVAAAAAMASSLNAFSRLSGRYALFAVAALSASTAGAAALAAVVLGLHGRPASPGWLVRARPPARKGWAAALLSAALALAVADRAFFVGLYPDAHFMLRVATFWTLMFSGAVWLRDTRWHVPWMAQGAAIVLGFVPALWMRSNDDHRVQSVRAMTWAPIALSALRVLSDVDGDGHSSLFAGGDCRPFDPSVHPMAREVPANGVDDNCMLGDAAKPAVLDIQAPRTGATSPLDVVLITIDSLRPDHLGVYDSSYGPSGRATSPALDRFAQKCAVFERAYSPGGGTNVAIGALMRGLFPRRLSWTSHYETDRFTLVRDANAVRPGELITSMFPLAFDDPRPSMAEWLRARNMATMAVVDDGFSELLTPGTGIERGFDAFYEVDDQPPEQRNDRGTAELAVRALQRHRDERRLFLWAHFFGPHAPNTLHEGARVYGESLVDGYDHEINFLDRQLQTLFAYLDTRSRPLAVIITSDHGDVLERGRYHGYTLSDDVIRIPLIACVPQWPAGVRREPVSLVDLLPTILALTGTPAPPGLDGIDLGAPSKPERERPSRTLLSDSWLFTADAAPRVQLVAAYGPMGKLTLDLLTGQRTLESASDLSASDTRGAHRLQQLIHSYIEETGGAIDLRASKHDE